MYGIKRKRKGIFGLLFKLIIHKSCSGLMCKEEGLEKDLEGKVKQCTGINSQGMILRTG